MPRRGLLLARLVLVGGLLLAIGGGTVPGRWGARGAEGGAPAPDAPRPSPAPAPAPSPSPAPPSSSPPPAAPAPSAPAGDPAATPAERTARAIEALGAEHLLEREEALSTLVRLGATARPALLAAWPGASAVVRPALGRALAAEGSAEAYAALRDALVAEQDPSVARALVRAMIEDPEAAARALEGVRGTDGSLPLPLAPVETLVRRARVERLFLSRKSRSGSTGSYPGQYDVLRPERALAITMCLAILRNESVKEPNVFPGGSWAFLRPPDFIADGMEFRHMAANALAELVTPSDTKVLDALESLYYEIRRGITQTMLRSQRRAGRPGQALLIANVAKAEEALLDTGVLPTLARHRAEDWREKAEARIQQLDAGGEYDAAAGLCLRLGEYGRAVGYFRDQLRVRDSPVLAYYNIACAYARWSLDTESAADRRDYRSRAVTSLVSSVAAGYADWPWIEQDRDLDAIREEPLYKVLVGKLKAEYPARGPSSPEPEGARAPR